ncbi:hypothetical protein DCC84_16355 [Pseudomonas sp. SXM-1]|nr:hypothetical protein DCC84_16355 [Pseudomonas sp. SXM-1]
MAGDVQALCRSQRSRGQGDFPSLSHAVSCVSPSPTALCVAGLKTKSVVTRRRRTTDDLVVGTGFRNRWGAGRFV